MHKFKLDNIKSVQTVYSIPLPQIYHRKRCAIYTQISIICLFNNQFPVIDKPTHKHIYGLYSSKIALHLFIYQTLLSI